MIRHYVLVGSTDEACLQTFKKILLAEDTIEVAVSETAEWYETDGVSKPFTYAFVATGTASAINDVTDLVDKVDDNVALFYRLFGPCGEEA